MGAYLVTGVAGFIGSALASALLNAGHAVIGLDDLSTGSKSNIPSGVSFYKGGCHEPGSYAQLPDAPYDAFFHMAGQSCDEASFDDPVQDLKANTLATLHLLQFARKCACKRFIYASSMAVYGSPTEMPVQEDAAPAPLSFHGVNKLASEQYLRLYEQYGVRSTALRFFSVYGPGRNTNSMRQDMIGTFMAMMLNNGHIHVRGTPNRFRDFIYIDDVVQACLLCLERKNSQGLSINIGSGCRVQVGELVDKLCAMCGTPVTVEYSGRTVGDVFGIHADVNIAAKYLGFEAETGLEDGLKRMYEWYTRTRAGRNS